MKPKRLSRWDRSEHKNLVALFLTFATTCVSFVVGTLAQYSIILLRHLPKSLWPQNPWTFRLIFVFVMSSLLSIGCIRAFRNAPKIPAALWVAIQLLLIWATMILGWGAAGWWAASIGSIAVPQELLIGAPIAFIVWLGSGLLLLRWREPDRFGAFIAVIFAKGRLQIDAPNAANRSLKLRLFAADAEPRKQPPELP